MKKITPYFLFFAMAAGAANAQQAPTILGLRGGLTLSSYTGDVNAVEYKKGFHVGVIFKLPVTKLLAVQPEVLYSMKGAQGNETSNGYSFSYDETLHYVNVPVLAKITTDQGLFFEAGPQLGVLVAARGEGKAAGPYGSKTASGNIKPEFNDLEMGYVVGLGFQLPDNPLLLGVRYNGGFTNIAKDYGDKSVRNSAFQFYLGVLFGNK